MINQLLVRILDEHAMVTAVQALPARALAKLIAHVGLEDAGELVALATTEQLVEVFDEDLWRRERPGEDERFDGARFVVWLEVMMEAGAAFTAQRLAELPEDLVVHALHQHVLVVDLDAMVGELAEGGEDAELVEKALDGCLSHEQENFRVISRRQDGWDAIVNALVALDERHHDVLMRMLERCAHLSAREVDDGGGLYEVLTSEDMLAGDVAAEREDRRAREGFVAPSSARAFLRLAATTPLEAGPAPERDAVTRAYFRELAPRAPVTASDDRLARLLREAGILDGDPAEVRRPRLAAGPASADEAALREAIASLLDRDPALHAARMAELGYLANVLVAGGELDGRAYRPAEAAAAAVATCARGLAHLRSQRGDDAAAIVAREPADRLFRLGWRLALDARNG